LVVGKEPADRAGPRPPGNSTATNFPKIIFSAPALSATNKVGDGGALPDPHRKARR
jgi:hypothetical protein